MEQLWQVTILAIVQGITEFVPISSSAHLIIIPYLCNWSPQGLMFDIAVHFGTLSAVLIYYKNDLLKILFGIRKTLLTKQLNEDSILFLYIIIATVPVGLAGLLGHNWVEHNLRSPKIIAYTTLGFGMLLWLAAYKAKSSQHIQKLTYYLVLCVALAQTLSLIPGVSRSGITLTACLFLGINYKLATKFVFLLAIPVILAASSLMIWQVWQTTLVIAWQKLILGYIVSAISGYCCISLFIKLLSNRGIMLWVYYRLILGTLLLLLFK